MPLYDFSLDIGPNEGFTPEKDIFGHKAFGERLTNLLANTNFPITLAIDAQWGEGKTTFLKMWAGHLRNEGFPVIEFDAFANDYYDDPFIPLAGEIVALASKGGIKTELANKAKKVGIALAKGAVKITAKALTLNALDNETFEDIKEDVANGLSDYAAQEVGDLIDRYNVTKNEFEAFRDALSQLPRKLYDGPKHEDGHPINPKPLIFIIDELDRCRPDYALRLLERVKHFYSVKNVHFAFGAHISSIENSVKSTYGKNINSKLYLQKFFSININLPKSSKNGTIVKSSLYLEKIKEKSNINFDFSDFKNFFHAENVSLRDSEKILNDFTFTYKNEFGPSVNFYIFLLITIRLINPDLFKIMISDKLSIETAREIVGKLYPDLTMSDQWSIALTTALTGSLSTETRKAFGIWQQVSGFNAYMNTKYLDWEARP